MEGAKEYVAVVDFSLNLDNGKTAINVKEGDVVLFDGLYAECRGEKGQARILSKVIGEWIQPVDGETVAVAASAPARPFTAGRVLENSSVDQDPEALAQQRKQNVGVTPSPTRPMTASKVVENSSADRDPVVAEQQRKRAPVINQDDTEVAKVSQPSKTPSNASGVQVEDQGKKRLVTVSEEERTVKKTAYTKTKDEGDTYKHLKVDKEASGVEVRKVKSPAIARGEARSATATSPRMSVSKEEGVAKETTYARPGPTLVGSSTQESVEMTKTASVQKREVISDNQEAVVVARVSKIPDVESADGLTVKMTSGASSVDDLDMSEVTFSGAQETITDLGGSQDDGNVDVDDILKEL